MVTVEMGIYKSLSDKQLSLDPPIAETLYPGYQFLNCNAVEIHLERGQYSFTEII
jgi:hypothetical protein